MGTNSKKSWLSSKHFIKLIDGKIIVWNYDRHEQFEISVQELARLLEFSDGSHKKYNEEDAAIETSGLLVEVESSTENRKWGWDCLSEIFHIGTCHPLGLSQGSGESETAESYTRSYVNFCNSIDSSQPGMEIVRGGDRLALPQPDFSLLGKVSLWDALSSRRTSRDFNSQSVDIKILSTLMYAAFGEMDRSCDDQIEGVQTTGYKRTSPSAGGLQSIEPYLWINRVEGLDSGIYHYLSRRHQLEILNTDLPDENLSNYLCNQHWSDDLSFAIFLTGRFDKMWWKYKHSRAYRPLLMDVGHLSQTALLVIEALGLCSWLTGYFHDKEINKILGLKTPDEQILFVVGAGYGEKCGVTRELRKMVMPK